MERAEIDKLLVSLRFVLKIKKTKIRNRMIDERYILGEVIFRITPFEKMGRIG